MATFNKYGFDLGEIPSISDNLTNLSLTISDGEETYTTTLYYDEYPIGNGWADNDEVFWMWIGEDGHTYLQNHSFDESLLGSTFTINLIVPEKPTQAFKEAVGLSNQPLWVFFDVSATPVTADVERSVVVEALKAGKTVYASTTGFENVPLRYDEYRDTIICEWIKITPGTSTMFYYRLYWIFDPHDHDYIITYSMSSYTLTPST